jgi:hypothetical protein
MANIKDKFNVDKTITGRDGVEAAFLELHKFIQSGGIAKNAIQLCNYIDLEAGLEVAADGGLTGADGGEISLKPGEGKDEKLRLIVVGINSFRTSPMPSYSVPCENKVDHIVFQFEYIPGKHRMNAENSNAGGYEASEMRKYLTPVQEDNGTVVGGNFLKGLKNAGVPVDDVLRRPLRYVAKTGATPSELRDLVWLPTLRELFKNGKDSGGEYVGPSSGEIVINQTWLGYYTGDQKRKKKNLSGDASGQMYWLASIAVDNGKFNRVNSAGTKVSDYYSGGSTGFVPAFCVY